MCYVVLVRKQPLIYLSVRPLTTIQADRDLQTRVLILRGGGVYLRQKLFLTCLVWLLLDN